jgi:hypothetical protein
MDLLRFANAGSYPVDSRSMLVPPGPSVVEVQQA